MRESSEMELRSESPKLRRLGPAGGRINEAWRTFLVGSQKPRGTLKLVSL